MGQGEAQFLSSLAQSEAQQSTEPGDCQNKLGHHEKETVIVSQRCSLPGEVLKCFLLDSHAQSLARRRRSNLPHLAKPDGVVDRSRGAMQLI